MALALHKLTALKVSRLTKKGLYSDGGGLYLQIAGEAARSWVFRYKRGSQTPRGMGLGSLDAVTLAEAREKAAEMRQLLAAGVDPIDTRRAAKAAVALDAARAMTFEQCAAMYISANRTEWRNEKHAAQWSATLQTYAYPEIGHLPVAAIDNGLVLKVLEPIWTEKAETASRIRGRIEAILDWAKARGYRTGENPARYRGNLQHSLPKRSKTRQVRHHPALSFTEVGAFTHLLRAQQGTAARALEFLILTVGRTSEVIGATWSEINLDVAMWIVPPDRIKGGKAHRVPLTTRALAILKQQAKVTGQVGFVFPTGRKGKALSTNALLALLKRMKRSDITAHGFRSSFRDWAAECTNFPREVAEMALAHVVSNKVEAAYRRGDLYEKRRKLMSAWATHCDTIPQSGKVVAFGSGR